MKRYYFKIPTTVAVVETAALYRFMATGESDVKEFLDKRHQILFDNLTHLQKQIGMTGTQQLITFLQSQNILEAAGGTEYIKKVFDCLEPTEVYA
jgi:replicative DNA helicase